MSGRSLLVSILALSCLLMVPFAFAQTLTPKFKVWPRTPQTNAAIATGTTTSVTVRHWSSSFTFNSNVYHYSMVGTNPSSGSATTTVSAEIQPLNFKFSDGHEIEANRVITPLIDSPIFQKTSLPGGFGQLADVEQRSNFHAIVAAKSPSYHVHLAQPLLLSSITVNVPAGSGGTQTLSNGTRIGLVDFAFMQQVVNGVLSARDFNPTTLPILLTGNVFEYENMPSNCCVVGFHGAVSIEPGEIVTFVYTAYPSPGVFSGNFEDITAASHEVAEWMDDPFTNNVVPAWGDPSQPTVCVNNLLEVGDPIENFAKPAFSATVNGRTYHPQDIAFFSWFAHQKPSIGRNGQYSYISPPKLTAPPPSCH